MKTLHFFGCSFTAGHELPDDDILPWKKDCKTVEDYYSRTQNPHPKYHFPGGLDSYISLCKSMAYPSTIEKINPEWRCVNHAEFGSSIKQEIFKAISIIENSTDRIDFLIFQVPHYTREYVLTSNGKLKSFTINFPITNSPKFNEYLEKSVMFHSANHWCLHGLLDLLMFQGYLRSKNIKFLFLDLEGSNSYSEEQLGDVWKLEYPVIFNLQFDILGKLLGGHLDLATHQNFARLIADKIKETI